MVGYAISRADLIVIPTQGSLLDAAEAVQANFPDLGAAASDGLRRLTAGADKQP
jgi:hypothetical protein